MLCKLLLLCSNFKVCFFGTSWNFFSEYFQSAVSSGTHGYRGMTAYHWIFKILRYH